MPKIDLDPATMQIIFDTTWVEKEAVKQIPGVAWSNRDRIWTAPVSYATCVIARGIFGDQLIVGDNINDWVGQELRERIRPALNLRERIFLDEPRVTLPGLYDFQRVGAQWLIDAGDGLLSDEQGTGKTIQVIAAHRTLHESGIETFPTVIISPNSVKRNWASEYRRWFPDANPIPIIGTPAQKTKLFQQALDAPNPVIIINIEAVRLHSRLARYGSFRLVSCQECDPQNGVPDLRPSACERHPRELNLINPRLVVVDEAHRIKDPRSKQTRAVWAVGHNPSVDRHWALTGTPIANAPDDLWSIMHFVHRSEYMTKSKWVDRFALMAWNNFGGLDIVGLNPEHRDEFYKFFDPRHRRMLKSVVALQLPPKIRQRRYVKMTPKQLRAYNEITTTLMTELDDGGLITTPSNLAKATRQMQFSSAYATIELDGGDEVVRLAEPSPKLDELMDIIADAGIDAYGHGKALVVTALHRQLLMLAAARLDKAKIPYGLIVGGVNEWQRDLALAEFQAGKTKVLLFTMSAGGTGLTMTAADTIVYLQRSWSMIDNLQSEDRVHRIGSEVHDVINVIDIITEDSIEERQLTRLYEKLARLEEINRDREQLRRRGLEADASRLDDEYARIAGGFV